jgi:hypothetical protein
MKRSKAGSRIISISTGLVLAMLIGTGYADETSSCTTICTSDLKECRKQAGIATSYEVYPALSGNSANMAYSSNGLGVPSIMTNGLPDSRNADIENRKAERYRLCATENNSCLHQCSPEPTSPKISVIQQHIN